MMRTVAAVVLAALVHSAHAVAQEAAGCKTALTPAESLKFEDDKHRKFYRRFWTGDCTGLSIFDGAWCVSGEPNWGKGIAETTQKHGVAEGSETYARLCKLGRSMGHEWARENDVRFVCTDDLKVWIPELASAKDLPVALAALEKRVADRLAAKKPCQK